LKERKCQHVIENWGPNIIRLFCLSGHYSKPIDYSEELLKENLTKWRQVETCHYELIHANHENGENIDEFIHKVGIEFDNALDSDLNTHLALSAFFQLVKETNRLAADEKLGKENSNVIKTELKRMLEILGLSIPEITDEEKEEVNQMIKKREEARKEKQFEEADKIRDRLNEMNVELIDHKGKTIWMIKEKIKAEK
jgi:cysteinyl-tRNA synthetase